MAVDDSRECRPARRAPIGTGGRLRAALAELASSHAVVVRQSERRWASVTFEGARHTFELVFAGEPAVAAGERFIADVPEHEFALPGQLVAEALVTAVDHSLVPAPRMSVTCELLLLNDA